MAYVIIAAELVASFLMLALFAIGSAFQDEGLRFSNGLTKTLDVVMFLILMLPAFLALVTLSREVRGRPWPLKPPWWFLTFLACGFSTAGLLLAKEELGHAAKSAALTERRAAMTAAALAGDGVQACLLVGMGQGATPEVFAVCRAHVDQASGADDRLRRLALFISGGWLQSWTEGDQVVTVVPRPDQVWFANTFFTALLEATPGATDLKPAPSPMFEDLLTVGSSISGIGRPEVLTHEALCAIAAIVPKLEASYAERLARATTANPERATYFRQVLGDARDRAGDCGTAP